MVSDAHRCRRERPEAAAKELSSATVKRRRLMGRCPTKVPGSQSTDDKAMGDAVAVPVARFSRRERLLLCRCGSICIRRLRRRAMPTRWARWLADCSLAGRGHAVFAQQQRRCHRRSIAAGGAKPMLKRAGAGRPLIPARPFQCTSAPALPTAHSARPPPRTPSAGWSPGRRIAGVVRTVEAGTYCRYRRRTRRCWPRWPRCRRRWRGSQGARDRVKARRRWSAARCRFACCPHRSARCQQPPAG